MIIDTREQAPWGFDNLTDGADEKPLVIQTEKATLNSGDYSISGFESQISIERKSKEDLYSTLTGGRERFERELERLQAMLWSIVIVEASLWEVVHNPPVGSRVLPKSIFRSVIALEQRFAKTHWRFCDERRFAEVYAFRVLERFWKDRQQESKGGESPIRP